MIVEEEHTHECIFDVAEIPISDHYERMGRLLRGVNGKVCRVGKAKLSHGSFQTKRNPLSDENLPESMSWFCYLLDG